MDHAEQRVWERLTDAGMSEPAINTVFRAVRYIAPRFSEDTAVRMLTLPAVVNEPWGERSNGNEVWAIYRNGAVQTVMLRRSTQPGTCAALRVERIVLL